MLEQVVLGNKLTFHNVKKIIENIQEHLRILT